MIFEIFRAAVHSVGTATTMTAAGVYLHRKGMITSETKTGMARYTQQIAIPALFFTKIVDCPQDFSQDQCPNILHHLGDAWVLLIWPFYVLGMGLVVGKFIIYLVQPPKWQNNCVLAAVAFANAMGMPITLLDVIGHNFVYPAANAALHPSMFQSIYVILNPVLQWGLGGWLLGDNETPSPTLPVANNTKEEPPQEEISVPIHEVDREPRSSFFRSKVLSAVSLEDAGYDTESLATPPRPERASSRETQGTQETAYLVGSESDGSDIESETQSERNGSANYGTTVTWQADLKPTPEVVAKPTTPPKPKEHPLWPIVKKIASKAMAPPAVGAMAGFVVAANTPLRGLFVDLQHRADNAPLEWIFDGILTLAHSAIPVNMCVVGVNLSIAAQRKSSASTSTSNNTNSSDSKTIAAVVLGKMLLMPLIGMLTVLTLKTFFWDIPADIEFQFYLVLLMNFVTPTANVVMVIAELGSGPESKNFMASLIGWQYVVAPILLSLTVMMIVWTAVL